MAKKIRFPLKLAEGAEVRTLDELREHFDLEAVLDYYKNGKLLTWLEDRYLEGEAEAIQALDETASDFQRQLCEVFQVEYTGNDVDLEEIARRQERLKRLREITDDAEFIENIDRVAFDQEELADLLDEGETKIYLCGEKFNVPASRKGVTYVGIKNPAVHISGKMPETRDELGIEFVGVDCDNLPKIAPEVVAEVPSMTRELPEKLLKQMMRFGEITLFYMLDNYFLYKSNTNNTWIRHEIATGGEDVIPEKIAWFLTGSRLSICADEIAYYSKDGLCIVDVSSLDVQSYPKISFYGRQYAFSKRYIAVRSLDSFTIDIYNRNGRKLHKIMSPLQNHFPCGLVFDGREVGSDTMATKPGESSDSEICILNDQIFSFKLHNGSFAYLNLDQWDYTYKTGNIGRPIAATDSFAYFNSNGSRYAINLKTGKKKFLCNSNGSILLAQSGDYLAYWDNNYYSSETITTIAFHTAETMRWLVNSKLKTGKFLFWGDILYCFSPNGTNCKFDLTEESPHWVDLNLPSDTTHSMSDSVTKSLIGFGVKYVCPVCGYVSDSNKIDACPTCKYQASKFQIQNVTNVTNVTNVANATSDALRNLNRNLNNLFGRA